MNTITSIRIIQKNIKFGAISVEMGFIEKRVLEEALSGQKKRASENKRPKLIGQILVESGQLTQEQLDQVIARQKELKKKLESVEKDAVLEIEENPGIAHETEAGKVSRNPEKQPDSSEKVQGGLILEIENNGLSAFLKKTKEFSDVMTSDDIYTILGMKNIQYGIEEAGAVEGFLKSSGFEENRFKIASGRPEVPGRNARIEYYFDTDHLSAGKLDENGNIDFRDRGQIPKVEARTLLAQKFPFRESKNGRDIFGRELVAEPAVDRALKIGPGAILSPDGTRAYSQISGHPVLDWSGNIGVIDIFTVKGNVGYKTGHIHYDGDITVQGGLKSGFRIDGYNIDIIELDGGEIYAQGNVTIAKGVNNAKIYSRGHVIAHFVHNSQIYCLGHVTVEKEIVDSKIESSGACRIKTGNIVNSEISFNQEIDAKNIGTEKTAPNKIRMGQDLFIVRELKEIDSKIADFENNIILMTKKKETFSFENEHHHQSVVQLVNEFDKISEDIQKIEYGIQLMENQSQVPEKIKSLKEDLKYQRSVFFRLEKEIDEQFYIIQMNKTKIKDIDKALQTLKGQIKDLNQAKINFTEWHKLNTGRPVMSVEGKIFSGTMIYAPHGQKEIKEICANVQIIETVVQLNDGDSKIHEIQINDAVGRR